MFDKRLVEVTPADVDQVCAQRVQEDEQVEYKSTFGRDSAPDPWTAGAERIGNAAKSAIAKELIAFANTRGGTLLVGIQEDGEKRAEKIVPVRACRALADRLAQSAAVNADPPLSFLEWAGVETQGTDGVVLIRVPASHRAPHRDKDSKECYARRGDRSEPMAMQEVQDLCIDRFRRTDVVERTLQERSATFPMGGDQTLSKLPDGSQGYLHTWRVRATAFPTDRLYVEQLAHRKEFHFMRPRLVRTNASGRENQEFAGNEHNTWRPILRGIRAIESGGENRLIERIIRGDGLLEVRRRRTESATGTPPIIGLPLREILLPFAELLIFTEAFRTRAGRPELEFALDFEWRTAPGGRVVISPGWERKAVEPIEWVNRVQDYMMPARERIAETFARIQSDVWSSFGFGWGNVYGLDFEAAVAEVLQTR
jgi:hypothetical protein